MSPSSEVCAADRGYAFGSYHLDEIEAVKNAVRFVKESGAEAVKLEGARPELVKRMLDAEVPVMGHIGLTPQSLHTMGGFKVQGKSLPAVERLMKDAIALDRAGVFSLVLEGIPREVATMITTVKTPTIHAGRTLDRVKAVAEAAAADPNLFRPFGSIEET